MKVCFINPVPLIPVVFIVLKLLRPFGNNKSSTDDVINQLNFP